MNTKQKTFFAIKPDGVKRNLIGEILSRFEKKGLRIIKIEILKPTLDLAKAHYQEHKEKDFFDKIVNSLCSGEICIVCLEGINAVSCVRQLIGSTDPLKSDVGTIRGDYGCDISSNVCHASDSIESAKREIEIWFNRNDFKLDD